MSSRGAFQHWEDYALCGLSDAAMWSCHLRIDGWLLRKHQVALGQAAPLPGVRSTEIVVWRREFIVVAIERPSAILPKDDNHDKGRWDGARWSKKISGNRAVLTSECVFWNLKCISPTTIIVPDIIYNVYLGMLKQVRSWVTSFLEKHSMIDKFNQIWAMMPPYRGFAWFNMPSSQVTQCSGKKMKALRRVIVPVFVATLLIPLASQQTPFTDALLCVKILVYFHLMPQYRYHTEATIEYKKNYHQDYHCQKDVFSRFRASKSTQEILWSLERAAYFGQKGATGEWPSLENLSAPAKGGRIDEDKTQI